MSSYVVADHTGNYLTKDTGRPYKVSDIRKAKQFSSEDHASAFLKNHVPVSDRKNYFVTMCEEGTKILQKMNADLFEKVIQGIDFENASTDGDRHLLDFQKFARVWGEELNQKCSVVDRKICDIQHYVEFGNFNAYQGWLCFNMLQKALRQRRKIKNEQRILDSIMASYNRLQNQINVEQSNPGCYYEPRELKHLFLDI